MAAVEPAAVLVGRVHIGRIAHRRGEFAAMRNRALYGALRDFALETAALLTEDSARRRRGRVRRDRPGRPARPGALPVQAAHGGVPRRALAAPARAAHLRRRGGASWAAAPAVAARERRRGATSAASRPSRRCGRCSSASTRTRPVRLPRGALRARLPRGGGDALPRRAGGRVVAPLRGVAIEAERIDLGDGLSLVRGEVGGRARARRSGPENGDGEPAVLCVLERDVTADDGITASEAEERFTPRGQRPAPVGAGADRAGGARLAAAPTTGRGSRCRSAAAARPCAAGDWFLPSGEEAGLREFFDGDRAGRPAAARGLGAGALRDGLRARLGRRRPVRLPARPAGAARRDQRRRRGEPGAARGGALRRGGPAPAGAAPRGVGDRAGALRDGRRAAHLAGGRLARRAGRRGGGSPARDAARRALRLPRQRPQGRGRRHPARDQPGAVRGDRGARPARARAGSRRAGARAGARARASNEDAEAERKRWRGGRAPFSPSSRASRSRPTGASTTPRTSRRPV